MRIRNIKISSILMSITMLLSCLALNACTTTVLMSKVQRANLHSVSLSPAVQITPLMQYRDKTSGFMAGLGSAVDSSFGELGQASDMEKAEILKTKQHQQHIYVRRIVYQQMRKAIQNNHRIKLSEQAPAKMKLRVSAYGLNAATWGSNNKLSAEITVIGSIKLHNRTIWRKLANVTAFVESPSYTAAQLKRNPKLLRKMWDKVAAIAAAKLLKTL